MAVNLVTVTGNLETLIGATPTAGRLWFKLNRPDWNDAGEIFAPEYVEAVAATDGSFSINLQSTADFENGATYSAILKYFDPTDGKPKEFTLSTFALPTGGPFQLGDLLALASGGAALLEFQFANRAALVAKVASGLVPIPGFTYFAGGLGYLGKAGATGISDLPGLVPAGDVTPEHFGAVGDGVANDGDAIKAAASYGGTIKAGLTYLMNGKTVTAVADGTVFEGNGTLIKTAVSLDPDVPGLINDTFFQLDNVNGFYLRGVTVRTTNSSDLVFGITTEDCTDIWLENMYGGSADTYGRMSLAFFYNGTTNCGLRNCVVQNMRFAVATGGRRTDGASNDGQVENFTVRGCTITDMVSEAIDINWNTVGALIADNTIANCNLEEADGEPIDVGGGICSDITIRGNRIECNGEGNHGIWLKTTGGSSTISAVRIEGNLIDGGHSTASTNTALVAIRLANGSSDIVVTGNTVRGFVRFMNDFTATGLIVSENHVTVHQVGGLNSSDTEYSNNTFIQTASATLGFIVVNGDNIEFTDNIVTTNAATVVFNIQAGADYFVARGNRISGGTRSFQVGSLGAEICGNTMRNPTQFGINLVASIGGMRALENTFIWSSAGAVTAINISGGGGPSNGCIIRSNLCYNTSSALVGTANLTNSLFETPLIAG